MPWNIKILLFSILTLFASACSNSIGEISSLESNFIHPPDEAKPRTWMHAMSGNMTKAGLTKDLESMAEVGIGGLLLFNISQGIPNGKIIYNSSEHHQMIQHTAKEAERLGLAFGVHNCDGWSSSGGPWVTPEASMKMVVWSETVVEGGAINTLLKEPSRREGLYEDIAVLAYPALPSEIEDFEQAPIVTASNSGLDINLILDGKIDAQSQLKSNQEKSPWIQFDYQQAKTIRSAKIIFNDRNATATLQVSEDGNNFKDVKELFKVRTGKGEWAINDHFPGFTAKHFRIKFNQNITLKEVHLTSNYFINNPLGRTAIARTEDKDLASIGTPEQNMLLNPSDIKNISLAMDESGRLQTELPSGKWTIIRFGYTSTGAFNNPASDAGRGLEVDKLNRAAFKDFFEGFVQKVIDNTQSLAPNALQYIEIDSYEMGGQNWTNNLDSIFSAQKGYDLINFLPLIAGRFVESAATSEAVLSDYRAVISNLMTENYFAYFTELCNQAGLKSYIEPYGFGPLNDLDIGGKTDLPMGEFWMNRPITQTASAVSAAHIYGKPIISAESFTSNPTINWKGNPAMAKTSGDLAWTYGINEFMFHRFAHQANVHAKPGMTMNRWGFHFDRTQTWWKNAGADWFKYIARGSYLLRQGHPVADLLVYVGEGAPNGAYHRSELRPELPKTMNFDNVNTDVLLNRMKIQENELVLPEGTSYKILLLRNSKVLSLATLRRLSEIINGGVPVYGEVPEKLAGFRNSEEDEKEFLKLQMQVAAFVKPVEDWNTILSTLKLSPDLEVNNDEPLDYAHRKTEEADIYFFFNADTTEAKTFDLSFRVADKIPELWNPLTGEIIRKADFVSSEGRTRTKLKLDSGASIFVVFKESAPPMASITKSNPKMDYSFIENGQIQIDVSNNGSYNVPLSSGEIKEIRIKDIPEPIAVTGAWEVKFEEKSGFGGSVILEELSDWKDHPQEEVKYYSGSANYRKDFFLPENLLGNDLKVTLDLGEVYIVAEVILNDKKLGISWMPPHQINISDHLKAGKNTLEISVTNQWSNKLIGEERYPANDGGYRLGPHRATDYSMPEWYINNEPRPAGKRSTFTTAPFYKKDSPLMPSGLLGPVKLRFSKIVVLKNK